MMCRLFIILVPFVILQFANTEYVSVEILTENDEEVGGRLRRGVSRMPDSLVFKLKRNHEKAILRLTKIPPLNATACREDGQHKIYYTREDMAAYTDYTRKAVILVTKHPDVEILRYNLEGHLQIGLRLIHIKPTGDGINHIIVRQEILIHKPSDSHGHRTKRSLKLYTIELGFVADYENFYSFFGRNDDNLALAEAEMRNYFAFIAEKMRVRYHHINEVDGTIAFELVTSGLTIVEERSQAWFTENFKDGRLVEAATVLNATLFWYENPPGGIVLPPSDHYMFFTGYNLVHAENLGNAGLAYTGSMCRHTKFGLQTSSSIVEDHRDGETGVTASHELGHALNANHDTVVGCKDSDSYIMSGQAVIIYDAKMAQRPWQFSSCSVRDIKAFVERTDVNCLNDNRYGTGVVTSPERPGQYFDINQQCEMKYGNGSALCDFPYKDDKDKLCYLVYCSIGGGRCSSARAMEYTTCDANRWCHRGLCIKANNTEPMFINLPTNTVEVAPSAKGVIFTIQTFDPDVEDVMTFHLTWDPAEIDQYFDFNQTTKQVSVKAGKSLIIAAQNITNFSLIMSVDDGLLRSLPVNINFFMHEPLNHPPIFTQQTYAVSVNEGKFGGVVINSLLSSVVDPDGNDFSFALLTTFNSNYFSIETTSGKITYFRTYDYDPIRLSNQVTLIVSVRDPTSLSATATFSLTIINVDQPSVFQNLPNSITVAEDVPPGTVLFSVGANDRDSTDTLRYDFLNPNSFTATNFMINSINGQIKLKDNSHLDYETTPLKTHSVTVLVSTNFDTVTSILNITIMNINEPPFFNREQYSAVTTTGRAGKEVVKSLTSLVSDPDAGDNVQRFGIRTGDYSYLFNINATTGRISFSQTYGTDRSVYPQVVSLVVTAVDTGSLMATAVYNITVNIANRPPRLMNLPNSVIVVENTPPGTTIFTARSEDVNVGDPVYFSLTDINTKHIFVIDNDGVITINTSAVVDYEDLPSKIYLAIKSFDGIYWSYPATLTITVTDINDIPRFNQTEYRFIVDEGKTGTILVTSLLPFVNDQDKNDSLTFHIVPSPFSNHFNVNASNGAISFLGDYDADPQRLPSKVDIYVVVRDSGLLFQEADVIFTINNVNQKPIFTNLPRTLDLLSSSLDGVVTVLIKASDADSSDILVIEVSFQEPGAAQYFSFSQTDGILSITNGTGITEDQTFIIEFTVTDGQLTDKANLTVNIIYTPEVPSTTTPDPATTQRQLIIINLPASVLVTENRNSDEIIYTVRTNILDNTVLNFTLQHLTTGIPELFTIDNAGQITVIQNTKLDYETIPNTELQLMVHASTFSGTINETLNITITDINEAPVFSKEQYIVSTRNGRTGQVIVSSLTATDPDSGDVIVRYGLQQGNHSYLFNMDETTGRITYSQTYGTDRRKYPAQVELVVTATDTESLTGTAVYIINVALVNRAARLMNLPKAITINENTPPGSTIFTVESQDVNVNDPAIFTMIPINAPGIFIISQTGVITINSSNVVNYETLPEKILLSIKVYDGKLYSYPATLSITVTDINEAPRFNQTKYSYVFKEGKAGQVLVKTMLPYVTEEDINDTITFSIVPFEYSTYISVDQSNGEISFRKDYDTDPQGLPSELDISIIVRDSKGLTGEFIVKLTINNVNQKPFFTNLPRTVDGSSDAPDGTVIYTVKASDFDSADVLVIAANLGNSGLAQYFTFNQTGGVLSMIHGSPMTEDQQFLIQFTVTDGQLTETDNLTVNITYKPPETTTTTTEVTTSQETTTPVKTTTTTTPATTTLATTTLTTTTPVINTNVTTTQATATTLTTTTPVITTNVTTTPTTTTPARTTPVIAPNVTTTTPTTTTLTTTTPVITTNVTTTNVTTTLTTTTPVITSNVTTPTTTTLTTTTPVIATNVTTTTPTTTLTTTTPVITTNVTTTLTTTTPVITKNVTTTTPTTTLTTTTPVIATNVTTTQATTTLATTTPVITTNVTTTQATATVTATPTIQNGIIILNLPSAIPVLENSTGVIFTVRTNATNITQLSFALQQLTTGIPTLFQINDGGVVSVASGVVIDYETLPSPIYLTITANDGSVSSDPTNLTVTITDKNEAASFNQTEYNFDIYDAKPVEVLIKSLMPFVTDPDEARNYTFSIFPSNGSDQFTINKTTGEISLAVGVEPIRLYDEISLRVLLKDSGFGFQSAYIKLKFTLVNHPPTFNNLPVTIKLQDSPVGEIFRVQVSDVDTGDVLKIEVDFATAGSNQYFSFDKQDKIVSLVNRSVFSSNQTVILQFTVTDGKLPIVGNLTILIVVNTKTTTVEQSTPTPPATSIEQTTPTQPTTTVEQATPTQPTATEILMSTTTNKHKTTETTGKMATSPTDQTTSQLPTQQPTDGPTTELPILTDTAPLFERIWVVAILAVTALIIVSLIILVVCIICKRRCANDDNSSESSDKMYDDKSQKSQVIRPAYHTGYYVKPEYYQNEVYYLDH